ncbi:MAG: tRNA pseudouridine(55) synthase TruB [Bacteroidota bacterium]
MDGILVVAKAGGMTSHDVVAHIRRATGIRRVGHAGTLDPDATGVLVVLLGRATRAMQFMLGLPKAYTAEIVLGIVTDTQDASGTVSRVAQPDEVRVSRDRFGKVLSEYTGEILQVPPMVSAVHHEGRRLYELARKGIEVERAPRRVTIFEINVESWPDEPLVVGSRVAVSVVCSSGTYIRQLAADIGESLGCGAHLGSLVRTRVGPFRLSDAHALDEIKAHASDGRLGELVLPVAAGLSHIPAVTLTSDDAWRLSAGAPVGVLGRGPGGRERVTIAEDEQKDGDRDGEGTRDESGPGLVRVHLDTGELIGIARIERTVEGTCLRPVRVFARSAP